jgi:hypothetical protein
MLTDEIKQKVEAATVKIIMEDDGFGFGVLIPGRMILTATHCVQHTADGGMAIGDYYIETLETSQGFLKAGWIMVECMSDLAVLGGLDGQEFWDELTAFDEFCETVDAMLSWLGLPRQAIKDFAQAVLTLRPALAILR